MRRTLFLVSLFTLHFSLFTALAFGQSQSVRITWIGQACFLIENTDGSGAVVVDPPVPSIGYPLNASANVVTVSHNHTDHNNVAGVGGNPTLVDRWPITARQEMTAAGITFTLIPGFHDNQNGALRGQNTIVRWTQGGITFAHFGDFGQDALTAAQLADVRGTDVIFVPAGGFFTIEPAATAALITQLNPRVAILMHFRTALGGPAQLAGFPTMVLPFADIVYKPSRVTIARSGLPAATEVWLMEVLADAVAVNAVGFTAGAPVASGSLVSLFGSFTGSATAGAAALPLPRKLGETEVFVGTPAAAVPLLYASPGQINFQVPRLPLNGQSAVEVRVGGQRVARGSLTIINFAPGIFAALNQDGRLNSATAPARRGQVVQIYASGAGETSPPVPNGEAPPSQPLSVTPGVPDVFIGGVRATVQFSGLAPGLVGLWQINAVIPSNVTAGSAVPLVVSQGLRSNTLNIAVE